MRFGQERDLHLRRAGVRLVPPVRPATISRVRSWSTAIPPSPSPFSLSAFKRQRLTRGSLRCKAMLVPMTLTRPAGARAASRVRRRPRCTRRHRPRRRRPRAPPRPVVRGAGRSRSAACCPRRSRAERIDAAEREARAGPRARPARRSAAGRRPSRARAPRGASASVDAKVADTRSAAGVSRCATVPSARPRSARQHAHVRALRAVDARSRCAPGRAASARADRSRCRAPRARPRRRAARACRAARRRASAPSTSAAPGAAGRRSARPRSARRPAESAGTGAVATRLAGAIEGVGRDAEPDRPGVRLPLEEQIARDLRRLAEAERQEPARERDRGCPRCPTFAPPRRGSSARGSPPPTSDPSGLSTSRMPVTRLLVAILVVAVARLAQQRIQRGARCPGVVSYSKRSSGRDAQAERPPELRCEETASRARSAALRACAARASAASVRKKTRAVRRSGVIADAGDASPRCRRGSLRFAQQERRELRLDEMRRRVRVGARPWPPAVSSAGTRRAPRRARRAAGRR